MKHKGECYPGKHEAIVDRALWERVHARRSEQAPRRRSEPSSQTASSPLAGKLFDENGEPLYAQATAKSERRYRYYVSRGLVRGTVDKAGRGWRVPAPELERAVSTVGQQLLTDEAAIATAAEEAGIDASHLPSVFSAAQHWSERLRSATHAASALAQLSKRIELKRDGIEITLTLPLSIGEERKVATTKLVLTRFGSMPIRRRGIEMRLVVEGTSPPPRVDLPLLKAVARAYRWSDDLLSGRVQSVSEIARRERMSGRYVRRVLRLAFLAPKIVEAIVEGRHPETLSAIALTRRIDLPALWSEQEQALGRR